MASRYISANIVPYKNVVKAKGRILQLNGPLASINSVFKDGKIFLPKMDIVTDLTFMDTADEDYYDDNIIRNNKKVDVIIRMTKFSNKTDSIYVDLDSFVIDIEQVRKDGKLSQANWEFYSYTRITELDEDVLLPFDKDNNIMYGPYILKVITKEHDKDEPYRVQGVYELIVSG